MLKLRIYIFLTSPALKKIDYLIEPNHHFTFYNFLKILRKVRGKTIANPISPSQSLILKFECYIKLNSMINFQFLLVTLPFAFSMRRASISRFLTLLVPINYLPFTSSLHSTIYPIHTCKSPFVHVLFDALPKINTLKNFISSLCPYGGTWAHSFDFP